VLSSRNDIAVFVLDDKKEIMRQWEHSFHGRVFSPREFDQFSIAEPVFVEEPCAYNIILIPASWLAI
jgi:hypothetical protein